MLLDTRWVRDWRVHGLKHATSVQFKQLLFSISILRETQNNKIHLYINIMDNGGNL